jgi:hypothetical protein
MRANQAGGGSGHGTPPAFLHDTRNHVRTRQVIYPVVGRHLSQDALCQRCHV